MKGSSNRSGEPRAPKVVSFNVENDIHDPDNAVDGENSRPKNDRLKLANARESKVDAKAILRASGSSNLGASLD